MGGGKKGARITQGPVGGLLVDKHLENKKKTLSDLPDELLANVFKQGMPKQPNGAAVYLSGVNRKFRNMYPTPREAVSFIQKVETEPNQGREAKDKWTLEGILEHIEATKGFAVGGYAIKEPNVLIGIYWAVTNKGPESLPLVLRALYDTVPMFVRPAEGLTFMYVRPIIDRLPELWYGFEKATGTVGVRVCEEDPRLLDDLPKLEGSLVFLWEMNFYFSKAIFEEAQIAGGEGWGQGATEEQQHALLESCQANACCFYGADAEHAVTTCRELLFVALMRTSPRRGKEDMVKIRDACV